MLGLNARDDDSLLSLLLGAWKSGTTKAPGFKPNGVHVKQLLLAFYYQ